jgi:hypothetical protein
LRLHHQPNPNRQTHLPTLRKMNPIPLWAKANIRKSDKITVKEFQPMLLLG